jgi:DNA repair exonuclease SbcCD ATPase subunit
MEDNRPVCNWKLDANGFANIKDLVEPEGGCRLPPGLRGWKSDVALVDENGHPADSDDPAADKCNHRDTPEWRAAHQRAKLPARHPVVKKETKMEEQIPAPVAVPEVPKTVAAVGVPAVPSADDLSRIAAHAGGGMNGILMALIAVVGGGGAVWKYLQSKQKASAKKDELAHEQRMKELELQADNQKRDDDKHGECESKRAALAAKVESAESQLRLAESALSNLRDQLAAVAAKADSAAEKAEKASSLSASAGSSDEAEEVLASLSKRISKLETAVKAKGKK